ncbi:MAG: DUF6094 domain-containing protein [Bacilli bacterium]|nr:DUF6094 domain-containing protein [Bacilli bacterium]
MSSIRELKMSFWRHKTNEANYGFFPTPENIVKMEMALIDFSEVEGLENSILNICDLSGGTGEQLYTMHEYLIKKGLSTISYYNELTKERFEIAEKKYSKIDNFNLLNSDFFHIKTRSESNKKVFTIIRNNPPYGFMDSGGTNVRMEDLFFVRNAEMQVDYGIQIFELPIHQLIKEQQLIRKIFYRYENISIFAFPEESFDKKQVCVIGSRKKINTNDIELAEKWRERLVNKDILSLDEVTTPVIKLNSKAALNTKPILLYRDGKVSETTLTNGFNAVIGDLLTETTSFNKDDSDLGLKIPIIEQLPGHIALDIYSGQYDGLIGDVLIKGGTNKVIDTIITKENNVEITTEIEKVLPYVEVTSASGETFIREHKEKTT